MICLNDFKIFIKNNYLMIISFVLLFFLLSNSLDSILNFDIESNDYVETTVDIDLDNDVLDLRQVLNVNAYKILKVTVFVFSFT